MSKIPIPTSKFPNTPSQSQPNKRRILAEVTNNPIDTTEMNKLMVRNGSNTMTNIPAPRYSTEVLKKLGTSTRLKSSIIPTATLDHIQKLVGISQNYGKKSPNIFNDDATLQRRLSRVEQSHTKDVQKRVALIKSLELQLVELSKQCDLLEDETMDIKREQKKYHHKLSELSLEFNKKVKKSEQTEDLVLKTVSHKEKLIHMEIQELKNTLGKNYYMIQQEFEKELVNARNYRDEESVGSLVELKSTEAKLIEKQEQVAEEKQLKIQHELSSLEMELNGVKAGFGSKITQLKLECGEKDQQLEKLNGELQDMKVRLRRKKDENSKLEQSIADVSNTRNNYDSIKADLNLKINNLQRELDVIEETVLNWENKNTSTVEEYNNHREKLDRETRLRRNIENSIMDYSGRLRVYINLTSQHKTYEIIDEDSTQLAIDDRVFSFNKIIGSHDAVELACEFSSLVEGAITGSNVSVIYWGCLENHLKGTITDCIKSNYNAMMRKASKYHHKGWTFRVFVRILMIDNESNELVNLLNGESVDLDNDLEIKCTKYEIRDNEHLSNWLSELATTPNMLILEVDASNRRSNKSFKTRVNYLDFTEYQSQQQLKIIRDVSDKNSIDTSLAYELVKHCFINTKCLNIFNLDDHDYSEYLGLAEKVNNMPNSYKRKM